MIPAAGLALLGYLDQNLTSILINRKSHNLKKPPAYHLDMLVRSRPAPPSPRASLVSHHVIVALA